MLIINNILNFDCLTLLFTLCPITQLFFSAGFSAELNSV